MSGITSGAATSGYENLSALLEFVKSPDFVDRIKELRDLEDSSRRAHDDAVRAKTEAEAAQAKLAEQAAAHARNVERLTAEKAAHAQAVARWQKVLDAADKALRGRD